MNLTTHPDFPDYLISAEGRVFRIVPESGRVGELNGRVLVSGYRQFKLVDKSGKQRPIRANRMIAECFLGPAPSSSHHVAHSDGNKLNNCVANLRWATAKENNADKIIHGTIARGSRVGTARLTEAKVIAMRAEFVGVRGDIKRLSKKYGVGRTTVIRVVRNEYWCHLLPGYSALDRKRRIA